MVCDEDDRPVFSKVPNEAVFNDVASGVHVNGGKRIVEKDELKKTE